MRSLENTYVPYLSASAVVIHYEETLYQVYAPLPYLYRLTTRNRDYVTDDVSVQQVMNGEGRQQQQLETALTATTTNLTDCFNSFIQLERVSLFILL